jgi:hypothetical protein
LGYYPVKTGDRRSEWRKGGFHLYTLPWAKRGVRLSLHEDLWKRPPPIFKHKVETERENLKRELQRIQQKYSETTQATR